MRLKIITLVIICFYSNLGFSQTRTTLHTFVRHLLNKPNINLNGIMYFHGERKEDYTIRLFSDSTFMITYFYTATGNYYPNDKVYETATGNFYNKDGITYLVRNNSVFSLSLFTLREIDFGTSKSKMLEQILTTGVPIKIEYGDNSLALYNSGGWSMIFTKKNDLRFNNPI